MVITIIPFGIVGSGKSTFLKTLTDVAAELKWSLASISSDAIRKELVTGYMAKFPKVEEKEAFDKTGKTAGIEFSRRLENLVKNADKSFSPVHIIFADKNHPVNGLDKTLTLVRSKLPQGCQSKCLYLIPKI